jgi:hypothetical protein
MNHTAAQNQISGLSRFAKGRFARRLVVAGMVISSVLGSAVVAVPGAEAKLRAGERAILVELLADVFERNPSSTSVNCIANRLPAGAMDELIDDAAFSGGDETALADSIAFRKFFRAMFLCKPKELVSSLASEFTGLGMTSRQRTCLAGALLGRYTVDDIMLTIAIRSGVGQFELADLDAELTDIYLANILIALRSCVPRAQANALLDEIAALA